MCLGLALAGATPAGDADEGAAPPLRLRERWITCISSTSGAADELADEWRGAGSGGATRDEAATARGLGTFGGGLVAPVNFWAWHGNMSTRMKHIQNSNTNKAAHLFAHAVLPIQPHLVEKFVSCEV